MKIERINKIQSILREENNISIEKLCQTFNVSKNTIRRDINELSKIGALRKVYGGIVLNEQINDSLEPYSFRENRNYQEKSKIGEIAATFVKNGDVIYIDSGTTTRHMIKHLGDRQHLTIVTASLYVLENAINFNNLNVIATGGTLFNPSKAFIGAHVLNCLKNYNFSKVFLASTGVSIEHGATNASPFEYEIKRRAVQKNAERYLLVDNSKFDKASLMTYSELKNFDYIVTDKEPPKNYIEYCKQNEVNIIVE